VPGEKLKEPWEGKSVSTREKSGRRKTTPGGKKKKGLPAVGIGGKVYLCNENTRPDFDCLKERAAKKSKKKPPVTKKRVREDSVKKEKKKGGQLRNRAIKKTNERTG